MVYGCNVPRNMVNKAIELGGRQQRGNVDCGQIQTKTSEELAKIYSERALKLLGLYESLFEKISTGSIDKHTTFPSPVSLLQLGENIRDYCPEEAMVRYLDILDKATEIGYFNMSIFAKGPRIDKHLIKRKLGGLEDKVNQVDELNGVAAMMNGNPVIARLQPQN